MAALFSAQQGRKRNTIKGDLKISSVKQKYKNIFKSKTDCMNLPEKVELG